MSDAVLTLQCVDDQLSHQLRITLYEEDGFGLIETLLPHLPFMDRLRQAWRYLMGRPYHGVADIVLSKEQVQDLKQFLVTYEYIDWKTEYLAQREREVARLPESRL